MADVLLALGIALILGALGLYTARQDWGRDAVLAVIAALSAALGAVLLRREKRASTKRRGE